MADLNARMERVIEEMAGNEALLEMLETDAAREMLNWGIAIAKAMMSRTRELDDNDVDLAILPRLKAMATCWSNVEGDVGPNFPSHISWNSRS